MHPEFVRTWHFDDKKMLILADAGGGFVQNPVFAGNSHGKNSQFHVKSPLENIVILWYNSNNRRFDTISI